MTSNSLSWCAWGLAALAAVLTVRNPYAQVVLALVLANAWLAAPRPRAFPARTAVTLAILPIVFSVVFSRFGDHLLFRIPGTIPLVSGPWTLDAALYGASTGMALFLIVLLSAVLRAHLRTAELLAVLPGFLQRGAGLLAMAMAFVPQTQATLAAVTEVRRLRGQSTGLRAVPGLFLPVVLTALERALQYAESLDARGFGARRRTRYRPMRWSRQDAVLVLSAVLVGLGLVLWPSPVYDAYTTLAPQLPHATGVASLAILAMPPLITTPGARVAARV